MIYSSKGSYVHPCMKGVVYACSCQQIISFNIQLHLFKNSHKTSTFRKGIKKALEITEKKEEKIEEVDLLFAEVVDESEGKDINTDDFFNQRFTPMCTPTKNRKELLGTFYLASLFD